MPRTPTFDDVSALEEAWVRLGMPDGSLDISLLRSREGYIVIEEEARLIVGIGVVERTAVAYWAKHLRGHPRHWQALCRAVIAEGRRRGHRAAPVRFGKPERMPRRTWNRVVKYIIGFTLAQPVPGMRDTYEVSPDAANVALSRSVEVTALQADAEGERLSR